MDETLLRDLVLLLTGASLSAFGQWFMSRREDQRRRQERLDSYRRDAADAVVSASEAVAQLSLPVAALAHSSVECTADDLATARAAAHAARSHLLMLKINHPDSQVSETGSEAAEAIRLAVMDASIWNIMNSRYGREERSDVASAAARKQEAARVAVESLQEAARRSVA